MNAKKLDPILLQLYENCLSDPKIFQNLLANRKNEKKLESVLESYSFHLDPKLLEDLKLWLNNLNDVAIASLDIMLGVLPPPCPWGACPSFQNFDRLSEIIPGFDNQDIHTTE